MNKRVCMFASLMILEILQSFVYPVARAVDFPEKRSDSFQPLTVFFTRPPELDVIFDVRYESDGTSCNGFNLFVWMNSGKGVSPAVFDKQFREINGTEEFTRELPVNQYSAGKCGWSPTTLTIHVSDKNNPSPKGQYPIVQKFSIGDFGVKSVSFNSECQYVPIDKRGGRMIICHRPSDQFSPRALLPEGAVLHVNISWKKSIVP